MKMTATDPMLDTMETLEKEVAPSGGGFWFGANGFWGEENYRGFVDSYKPDNLINVCANFGTIVVVADVQSSPFGSENDIQYIYKYKYGSPARPLFRDYYYTATKPTLVISLACLPFSHFSFLPNLLERVFFYPFVYLAYRVYAG